jgi:hypothetical protein
LGRELGEISLFVQPISEIGLLIHAFSAWSGFDFVWPASCTV